MKLQQATRQGMACEVQVVRGQASGGSKGAALQGRHYEQCRVGNSGHSLKGSQSKEMLRPGDKKLETGSHRGTCLSGDSLSLYRIQGKPKGSERD